MVTNCLKNAILDLLFYLFEAVVILVKQSKLTIISNFLIVMFSSSKEEWSRYIFIFSIRLSETNGKTSSCLRLRALLFG